jgi:hypothetical protein
LDTALEQNEAGGFWNTAQRRNAGAGGSQQIGREVVGHGFGYLAAAGITNAHEQNAQACRHRLAAFRASDKK